MSDFVLDASLAARGGSGSAGNRTADAALYPGPDPGQSAAQHSRAGRSYLFLAGAGTGLRTAGHGRARRLAAIQRGLAGSVAGQRDLSAARIPGDDCG